MTATSQIQKHFQMHSMYKRSKRYYDVQKLKQQQHLQQLYRRKPNYSIQTLDTRVDQSFTNAANAAHQRLQHDISQFKKRFHDESQTYTNSDTIIRSGIDTEDEFYQISLRTSRNKIKAPDLTKMPARKTFGQNKIAYNNQDQFNNFNLASPRSKAQLNFSLNSPRSKSQLLKPEKQKQEVDSNKVGKTQEKNHFNSSVYKCLFDYSKVNKYGKQSRKQKTTSYFQHPNPQKLKSAVDASKTNVNPGIKQFYFSVGKQVPMQMNYRYNKVLENYYKKVGDINNEQDYSSRKRKQDMIEKRLNQIKDKKKVIDSRDQLCDYKYFNRDHYRNSNN